jgi:NADPH:quinone reductase-like Zn-dependent oxidoreductase
LRDFDAVMDLATKGLLRPAMDRTFELADTTKAQRRLESREQFARMTLEIG